MSAVRFHPKAPPFTGDAGVAQLAEQLICNQQVVGSIPITSSTLPRYCGVKFYMGGLQSGQMHQTVNLTSPTSVVRIHLLPPMSSKFEHPKIRIYFREWCRGLCRIQLTKKHRATALCFFYTPTQRTHPAKQAKMVCRRRRLLL